jgi:dihydrodipicolinate synthase/N-acetylneuraminate lyase
VRIFGGFIDRLGLSVLRDLGGDGNIDGGGLGAKFAVAFYEAFWHGNDTAALYAASRYVALMTRLIRPDWSGTFGSPQAQIKACMNMLGQHGGHVRPPLLPIDDPGHVEMLRHILEEAGLFADETRPALALE